LKQAKYQFEETLGKGNAVDWEGIKNQASCLGCEGDLQDQIHGTRALRHGWGAFFSEMQGASGGRGVLPSVSISALMYHMHVVRALLQRAFAPIGTKKNEEPLPWKGVTLWQFIIAVSKS